MCRSNYQLNLGLRVLAGDGFREALKPIDAGNQNILDTPVPKLGQYGQPELSAFGVG